ncbi:hypothetical protein Tco_1431692, partial [Tanacetum coccineum]
RLYLSSTSSTMIVDDEQIPVLKQFKSDDSGIELAKELLPADSTGAKAGTLENLLISMDYPVLRLELEVSDDTAQAVVVMFDETARIVVKCSAGSIVGSEEQEEEEFPICRYRLELEVSDDTAQAVVVMFDETARTVVKCSAGSIMGSEEHVYFPQSTQVSTYGPKPSMFMPLATTPSVTTPSKPGEQKKPHSEERHDSNGEESFVADSKTKGSDVGCSSEAGKRRRLVLDSSE